MAAEDIGPTTIVSDALAARVATVRAVNAASARQPAPPPDEMASPWPPAPPRPVQFPPEFINRDNIAKAAEAVESIQTAAKQHRGRPPKKGKQESAQVSSSAWDMLDRLLTRWARQIAVTSRERANFELARSLMSCGASFLRARVPVEAVASIVRLSNELAEAGGQIDEDDKRINELRRQLRSEVFDTEKPAGKPDDEDEEDEEENGSEE
jgi:hypothetical protein